MMIVTQRGKCVHKFMMNFSTSLNVCLLIITLLWRVPPSMSMQNIQIDNNRNRINKSIESRSIRSRKKGTSDSILMLKHLQKDDINTNDEIQPNEHERGSLLFGHERILYGNIPSIDGDPNRQMLDNANESESAKNQQQEKAGWFTPEINRIMILTAIVVLLSIGVVLTIGWLIILYLRCKYQREAKKQQHEQQQQLRKIEQKRRQKHLQRLVDNDEFPHYHTHNNDYEDDGSDTDDNTSCFSNAISSKSGTNTNSRNMKQFRHHKLKSSTPRTHHAGNEEYYFSQKPQHHDDYGQNSYPYNAPSNHHHFSSTPSKHKKRNHQRQHEFDNNTSFFPISFQRNHFESPYASSDIIYNNNNSFIYHSSKSSSSNDKKTYNIMSNATNGNVKRYKKQLSQSKSQLSPTSSSSLRNAPVLTYDESGIIDHHTFHNNDLHPYHDSITQHHTTFIHNDHHSHKNYDDDDDDDDNDSFGMELQSAIRADHNDFMRKQKQTDHQSTTSSSIPRISPPKKDVAPIQIMDYVKDSFALGVNYMQGFMYNSNHNNINGSSNVNVNINSAMPAQGLYNNSATSFFRSGNQTNSYKDPEAILTLTSTSGSSANTSTSSSYAGKNSSVEEGEVHQQNKGRYDNNGFDDSGFQVIHNHNHHQSRKGKNNDSDEINAYLLRSSNNDNDESSFGNHSGMEMSLGESNRSVATITSSVARLGFHTIDDDKEELMYDYIPRDEYKAAVLAAVAVIDNESSKKRGRGDIDTPRISNALRKMTFSPGNDKRGNEVPNIPSDETHDEMMQRVPNHHFDIDLDTDTTTTTTDGHGATVTTNSSSYTSTNSQGNDSSKMLASASSDNNKLFKELKNVSIFLKRYEKKKNLKRQQRKIEITENLKRNSSPSNNMMYNENNDEGYDPSYNESVDVTNSTSSPESLSQNNKYRHSRGQAHDRVDQIKRENPQSPLESITMSRKHQRGGTEKRNQHSLTASIKANRPTRPPRDPRSGTIKAQKSPPIGLSPSLDSTTSDANFLESEIHSFFSAKDASMVSTSLSDVASTTITNSSPPSPISRPPFSSRSSKYKEVELSTLNQSEESVVQTDSLNRLGAAPFNPLEPMARSIGNMGRTGDNNLEDKSQRMVKRNTDEKPKSRNQDIGCRDHNLEESEKGGNTSNVGADRAKSSFIGEKAQNLRSMVAGLESKIENGAASLVQRFNTKRSGSPTTASPNYISQKKVHFSPEAVSMNQAPSIDAESYKTPKEDIEQHSKLSSMVSPTLINNRIAGRKSPQMSGQGTSLQDQNSTPANTLASDKPRSSSPNIVERISPKINSTARSLISMFESQNSNSAPITPQNEYWQYTGKLKNKR